MRFLLCYAAFCAVGMASAHARSHKATSAKPAGVPRIGVLFLAPPPSVDAKLIKTFRKELFASSAHESSFVLVSEAEITKALHKDPRKFLRTCGRELACLLGIIHKANLDQLLLGRWVQPDSPMLQYALISGATNQMQTKGSVAVPSIGEATQAARDNFAKMFGISVEEAAPPAAPSESAPPPKPLAPTPAPAPVAATQPPPEEPAHPAKSVDTWFVSTLAVTIAGVGAAATGTYLLFHGHALANSVTQGVTPQPTVVSTYNDANNAIELGNIFITAGGVVAAVGATLFTLHELGIVGAPSPSPDTDTAAPDSSNHAFITPLAGGLDVGYVWEF